MADFRMTDRRRVKTEFELGQTGFKTNAQAATEDEFLPASSSVVGRRSSAFSPEALEAAARKGNPVLRDPRVIEELKAFDRSGPSAEGHSATCPDEEIDSLRRKVEALQQYAKHLTGCGIFDEIAALGLVEETTEDKDFIEKRWRNARAEAAELRASTEAAANMKLRGDLESLRAKLEELIRQRDFEWKERKAEAGERKRLEAEVGICQRNIEFNQKTYLEQHGGSWGKCKYQAQVEAEAERARGLEAQLETARQVCDSIDPLVQYWSKREIESPANHMEFARESQYQLQAWNKLRAALYGVIEIKVTKESHRA